MSFKSSKASSSVLAVVVMVIFIPLTLSTLSYSISGKMICSFKPERVIASSVKGLRGNALEVSYPRQDYGHQLLVELVHPLPAQRHHTANGHPFPQLERRYRFARLRDDRLLTAISAMSADAASRAFIFCMASPSPMFTTIFVSFGTCMTFLYLNFCISAGPDLFFVLLHEWRFQHFLLLVQDLVALLAVPRLLAVLEDLRSNSHRLRALLAIDHDVRDVDRLSLSMMPPFVFWLGRTCRLIMFTFSTMTRSVLLLILSTLPVLPLSFPAVTITMSFFFTWYSFSIIPHTTSGARETIFMKRFARSSLATGPKILVPTGSLYWLMMTAELSSNRT